MMQLQKKRPRNRLSDTSGGEEGEGEMNGERGMDAHPLLYVKQTVSGICYMNQGAQTRAL